LKEFSYYNAQAVDDGADFHTHMKQLISGLNDLAPSPAWQTKAKSIIGSVTSARRLASIAAVIFVCCLSIAATYPYWDHLFPPPKDSAMLFLPPGERISQDVPALRRKIYKGLWDRYIDVLSNQVPYRIIPDDLDRRPLSLFQDLFSNLPSTRQRMLSEHLEQYSNKTGHQIKFLVRPDVIIQSYRVQITITVQKYDPAIHDLRQDDDAQFDVIGPLSHADLLTLVASYRLLHNLLKSANLNQSLEQIVTKRFATEVGKFGEVDGYKTISSEIQAARECHDLNCVDRVGDDIVHGLQSAAVPSKSEIATAAEALRLQTGRVE
jgi:hypothetical protein